MTGAPNPQSPNSGDVPTPAPEQSANLASQPTAWTRRRLTRRQGLLAAVAVLAVAGLCALARPFLPGGTEADGDTSGSTASAAVAGAARTATARLQLDQLEVRPAPVPVWTANTPPLGDALVVLDEAGFGAAEPTTGGGPGPSAEIPLYRRWQIEFAGGLTEGEYTRGLDALGIELGVLQEDGNIDYVSDLSQGTPKKRSGTFKAEKRLYFTWDRGELIQADRLLLANQQIRVGERPVLHFCPPETVARLKKLEQEYRQLPVQRIALTRFSVKRTFRGYEVFVVEQRQKGENRPSDRKQ